MENSWITHPLTLNGDKVCLIPLEREQFEELYEAASDKSLWEFIPSDCSIKENFDKHYNLALQFREEGSHYPFVIIHKPSGKIIGSTRFLDINLDDKKLEIGWTWITREFWGTTINFECKLLLLTYCFETLGARRVQLKTKDTNIRSRTAIQKIGAKFEGILRKDKMQANGISRNSVYFSILDDEWQAAKEKIIFQISQLTKMNPVSIIEYQPFHQPYFEKLNRQWIEKYFEMEHLDELILTNPEHAIIAKGGVIFMAEYNRTIAGTVALRKIDNVTFEFTKMAVDEGFQRKGIAEALSNQSLQRARELGASRVILYTNRILQPAIRLYEKLGFKHVEDTNQEYKRADVKMIMEF